METTYEVGKTYDLPYEGLTVLNNEPYITVTDGKHNYTLKPYDYQIEYSVFPKVVKCYVRKIGYTGAPYFEQLKEQVLQDRYYQTDVNHEFTVSDILIDPKTNKVFYILSDEYGIQHRFYPGDDEIVKKSGDRITLLVKGILPSQDGKNNARLDLCLPGSDGKAAKSAAGPVYPRNAGKKHFGQGVSGDVFRPGQNTGAFAWPRRVVWQRRKPGRDGMCSGGRHRAPRRRHADTDTARDRPKNGV